MSCTAGRIIIHPASRECGERLAETIRTTMKSDNHPHGFSAEWNISLEEVAELTIRAPVMGPPNTIRHLIEATDGGLANLNIAMSEWPATTSGGVRYLKYWDEDNGGQRLIRFSATKTVVNAIMNPPHQGKAFIGYLMGTVKHERHDVKPGCPVTYKRQFTEELETKRRQ